MTDLSFGAESGFGDTLMFPETTWSTVNAGTVSPKDLQNGGASAPQSARFTDLDTPASSYLETPAFDASPMLGDFTGYDTYGFFPELDTLGPQQMGRTVSTSSINQITVHPGGAPHARKHSVASLSPAVRPSSGGIKKREKALPPITVDSNDTIALKRARNTAAARKSRARKVEERDDFQSRITELEAQLAEKEAENANLAGQLTFWKAQAGAADE